MSWGASLGVAAIGVFLAFGVGSGPPGTNIHAIGAILVVVAALMLLRPRPVRKGPRSSGPGPDGRLIRDRRTLLRNGSMLPYRPSRGPDRAGAPVRRTPVLARVRRRRPSWPPGEER